MSAAEAQTDGAEADLCMNAHEIQFPLELNDFSKNAVVHQGNTMNAFYYMYQDKYTFWYKFTVQQATTIRFTAIPTNEADRYGVTAFRYGDNDFCEKLVNDDLQPEPLQRSASLLPNGKVQYVNAIDASAGDAFYISVLALKPNDCGHFLKVEADGEQLSMHAIHRPCYVFGPLEVADFEASKIYTEDVALFLESLERGAEEPSEEVPSKQEPPEAAQVEKRAYESLGTIEVAQQMDDDLISVGDRLVLNQVFFYNNTYAFKPEAESELQQLLNFMLDNPNISVEIEGHAANDTEDIRPDPNFKGQGKEWNFKGSAFKLSEKRAEAVRQYLIDNGVGKKRLTSVGYGDTRKRIPDAETFEEFEKNMRVEILITGQ